MKPEKEKRQSNTWNIGWGWFVTVPAVLFFTWAAKRGLRDTFSCRDGGEAMDAIDVLKARYAIGEIDKNEFEEMLEGIRQAR